MVLDEREDGNDFFINQHLVECRPIALVAWGRVEAVFDNLDQSSIRVMLGIRIGYRRVTSL
jgi:hypothetical protein